MFERATAFSAILIFILLGMAGSKYLNYLEAKNQGELTPVTSSQ